MSTEDGFVDEVGYHAYARLTDEQFLDAVGYWRYLQDNPPIDINIWQDTAPIRTIQPLSAAAYLDKLYANRPGDAMPLGRPALQAGRRALRRQTTRRRRLLALLIGVPLAAGSVAYLAGDAHDGPANPGPPPITQEKRP